MKAKVKTKISKVGRFVMVPYHIVTAQISPRAREVWILIASNGSVEKPEVWVRQPTIAKIFDCSTDVVGRAIKELKAAGFLIETYRLHQGRHKIYHVNWFPVEAEQSAPEESEGMDCHIDNSMPMPAIPETDALSETDVLLSAHGVDWLAKFPCLDGLSGRPSLRESVEHGLNHSSRDRCKDLKIHLDAWLRNASRYWISQYNRELSAPASDPTLSREAVARKLAEDDERRKRYEERKRQSMPTLAPATQVPSPKPETQNLSSLPETEEERAWIIKSIMASNERQRRREAQDARDRARFLSRGQAMVEPLHKLPAVDKPICRENNPIMWDFLRIQWADGRLRMAA